MVMEQDRFSGRLIYTLQEASKIADLSVNEMLGHGCSNHVRLCVRVNREWGYVCCTEISVHGLNDSDDSAPPIEDSYIANFHDVEPIPMDNIDALFLTPSDCQEIRRQNSYSQKIFKLACKITNRSSIEIINPVSKWYSGSARRADKLKKWRFAIYPHEPKVEYFENLFGDILGEFLVPRFIELSIENLSITSQDLDDFLKKMEQPPSRSLPNDTFHHHENKSSILKALDQIAFELFSEYNPTKTQKYRTQSNIEKYIFEHHLNKDEADVSSKTLFSNNLIKVGAKIIIHEGKTQLTTPTNELNKRYRSKKLEILIKAWEFFYGDVDRSKQQYQPRIDVTNYFKGLDSFKKPAYLPEGSATIICADNAPSGRRQNPER